MNLVQDKVLGDTNKSGETPPLWYSHSNKEMLMLGMHLLLDGNNKDQVEYMHKKATD